MKTLRIVNVRTVFNTDKPVVIFDVQGAEAVLRSPKLALIDLQNSGRALRLPSNCVDNGVASMNPMHREIFIKALKACRGAVMQGDITAIKEGDSFIVREGHPALTNPNHPSYGVKVGESIKAVKGTVWVEGFLDIPLTDAELNRELDAEKFAEARVLAMTFDSPFVMPDKPAVTGASFEDDDEPSIAVATVEEAFGEPAKAPKAK